MKLACLHCKGVLLIVETRGTAEMVFRTRRCTDCQIRVVTCEAIFTDGFIPNSVRRAGVGVKSPQTSDGASI